MMSNMKKDLDITDDDDDERDGIDTQSLEDIVVVGILMFGLLAACAVFRVVAELAQADEPGDDAENEGYNPSKRDPDGQVTDLEDGLVALKTFSDQDATIQGD